MKKFLSAALALIFIISTSTQTHAISTDSKVSVQEEWKTTSGYEYPLTPTDSEWASLSYSEQLDACNMPAGMLSSCSTEDLADLVLEYPFISDILAFNTADLAINHLVNTSNICKEFFSRDNSIDILISKYDAMNADYNQLQDTSNVTAIVDSGYMAELFLQTYFAYSIHTLTDSQIQKVSEIIGEKFEAKKGICDDFSTSLLIYDWLQLKEGAVSRKLVPENIEVELTSSENNLTAVEAETDSSQPRAASGFTSSGKLAQFPSTNGIYTVGTYTLYGKTVGCYRYYSNDYTTSEATLINNNFDNLHPSWTRVSTCTKKYNCHSYTWINSSSSNIYWLNNPDFFAESSSFTFVGHQNTASLSSGDKIIINSAISFDDGFGNITYAVHSANVLSSSGSTKSKLGACGVYIVPVDELRSFYSGFFYNVYR